MGAKFIDKDQILSVRRALLDFHIGSERAVCI